MGPFLGFFVLFLLLVCIHDPPHAQHICRYNTYKHTHYTSPPWQVLLTDNEPSVLANLRTSMHMNVPTPHTTHAPHIAAVHYCLSCSSNNGESSNKSSNKSSNSNHVGSEDADTAAPALARAAARCGAWEAGNMAVRQLDWADSLQLLVQRAQRATETIQVATLVGDQEKDTATAAAKNPCCDDDEAAASPSDHCQDMPPAVPLQDRFPVVLGCEVMYEPEHALLVASALAHRLEPGGRALLCCAVRYPAVFSAFASHARALGLVVRTTSVMPAAHEAGGIRGRDADYAGGHLLLAVEHGDAPAPPADDDDVIHLGRGIFSLR